MFFQDLDGTRYPVSRIVEVRRQEKGLVHVELSEPSKIVQAYGDLLDRVLWGPMTTIPASPGTYALDEDFDNDEQVRLIWRVPIIGWSINQAGDMTPIVARLGVAHSLSITAILHPDGFVADESGPNYPSLEEYLAQKQARLAIPGRE
ncbi:hypothetical protein [Sphingomonas sp. CCH15-F11]|uniref:hypothetical protein n=1 Tax=Sphingomonas sp. CCH15-F11 TaxID=1768785 RepID=UPI000834EA86|nr:hypothetical protein [Sphingomonas sp. CCH15-F11]